MVFGTTGAPATAVLGRAAEQEARRHGSRLSLRARLRLLVALCVLPLLGFIVANDYFEYRTGRAAAEAQAEAQARSFADDVGRLLQSEVVALQTLALSTDLHSGRFEGFRQKAEEFLALRHAPAALRVDDAQGRSAFSSALVGAPAMPETLQTVFTLQRVVLTTYHPTALAGRPGFCIHVPVIDQGRVLWDLQLILDLSVLSPIVVAEIPPHNSGLAIVDGEGRVLVHRPLGRPHVGQEIPGPVQVAMRYAPVGIAQAVRDDGTPLRLFFARVPGSDWSHGPWHVFLSVPTHTLLAPLYRTAGLSLLAGAALLFGGLALAGAVARRITHPIARLQDLAAAPDTAAPPPPTGLPETDAVAAALHATAVARRDALSRLQALTETLETRVVSEVAARQAAQAQAAHGERMQALGQLASGIAHDFNNVLQAVSMSSQLLLVSNCTPGSVQRVAQRLAHAAEQGTRITGRLLRFSHRGAGLAVAPLALPPLLAELQEMLATTLGSGIRLEIASAPEPPEVLADRSELETVLINLAANARDAMPQGGRLTLTAAPAGPALPPVLPFGRYVVLAVADTGTGMPPEVLARVTEPFFTTKPAGQGTGLGLTLARNFAEQCGGTLTIASIQGQGTTVRLWLPAAGG